MDDDGDLNIKRELERNKSISGEVRGKTGSPRQIKILIDIYNHANSKAQLKESNIVWPITNHWDKEIFKLLFSNKLLTQE